MNSAPPGTPWAAIGLLVLGVGLFYAAACTDTGGPPTGARRAWTRVLVALSGTALAGSVLAAVVA